MARKWKYPALRRTFNEVVVPITSVYLLLCAMAGYFYLDEAKEK